MWLSGEQHALRYKGATETKNQMWVFVIKKKHQFGALW